MSAAPIETLEGKPDCGSGPGRTAFVPAFYAALSYGLVCFVIYAFDDPDFYALSGEPNRSLFQNSTWFVQASLLGAAATILVTYFFSVAFPREWLRTIGMALLAAAHVLIGFGSALYYHHSHFLFYLWPGLLSVAMLWTATMDFAYAPEEHWKWESASFVAIFVGLVALIPYLWSFSHKVFPLGVFLRKNVFLTIQGFGLLYYIYLVIRRLSPKGEPYGLMSFLRMMGALVQAVFQGYQQGRSATEVSGAIEETIRNLLADMKGKTRKSIMYTAIESSTAMIEDLGDVDAYRLFQTSWEISCREIKAFGGSPPKDLGDGLLTTFDTALNAIKAALAVQKAHAAFNAGQPRAQQVRLRIGIHAGHIFLHQRWDPRGRDSHLAQRVSGAAKADQILITQITLEEARKDDPNLPVEPLGGARLKGIQTPVELYQVTPGTG
jgi:class 3 adenylate cyclase